MENASETIIHIAHPAWEWACTTFYTAYNCAVGALYIVCQWLDNLLKYLDPSLFQTVIIAAIAIYIPFIISHTTDIMVMDKKRDELTRMVINDELLQGKNFFIHTIAGVFLFSFASGVDSHLLIKLLSIIGVVYLICFYWQSLKKAFLFSEGKQPEFEMSFLKKLVLPGKYRIFKDKATPERMIKVWTSLWSRTNIDRERKFTEIFTSHMDDAIAKNQIELAAKLSRIYLKNIDNRGSDSISYDTFPKFFAWYEKLWNMEQIVYPNDGDPINAINKKTFLKKINLSKDDWPYWLSSGIRINTFKAIAERLLKEYQGISRHNFFSEFKKHINKYETLYDNAYNKQSSDAIIHTKYISSLFSIFIPIFLEELRNVNYAKGVSKNSFPNDWKITSANSNSIVARIVSKYFMRWVRDKLFYYYEVEEPSSKGLELVIRGLLPKIHPYLFRAFLILLYNNYLQAALAIKTNIPVWYSSVGALDATNIPEADITRKFDELEQKQDASQKEETIQIILKFYRWDKLTITEDDISPKQYKDWKNYSNEEQQSIIYKVRKKKLSDLKKELKSTEITKFCAEGTIEEYKAKKIRRTEFLELTNLLLKAIEKPV